VDAPALEVCDGPKFGASVLAADDGSAVELAERSVLEAEDVLLADASELPEDRSFCEAVVEVALSDCPSVGASEGRLLLSAADMSDNDGAFVVAAEGAGALLSCLAIMPCTSCVD
jgi:hypothetical protein